MKNNSLKFFLIIFILFLNNPLLGNDLIFDTEKINIIDEGKTTIAENGTAYFANENLEINGERFKYDSEKKLLEVSNANSISINDNIRIKAKKIIFNRNTSTIIAKGNVKLDDLNNNSKIFSEELIYNNSTKKIISNTNAKFLDDNKNNFFTESFHYNLNTKIAKINSLKLVDNKKNQYFLEKGFLNTKSKRLVGKDVFVDLDDALSAENNYRIKSLAIEREPNKTTLKKAVFTPCKKNGKCPPWQLTAETLTHDQKKKTMYYKNAWLKIYDKPVLYFPKFFHPDPTVKRQTGFLIPSFSSSKNLGNSFNIPYYKVFSENKDLTFTPRLFTNNKLLSQSEYRQIGKNYNHKMDFSILVDDDTSGRSHFFSKTSKSLDLDLFEESNLTFDIQQVSNDSYLKSYKIRSPLIENDNLLTSSINFDGYNDDLIFNSEMTVYENLSKENNDRYEYILPSYSLTKQLDPQFNLNGNFEITSSGSIKNYNTNVSEKTNINDLVYTSNSYISNNGLENNLNLIIKNVNSESENSSRYKDSFDSNLSALTEFNSSFPLIKKNGQYQSLLIPKISLRYNPSNTKNKKEEIRQLNNDNIYDLNRLAITDTLEGGESLTYGTSYLINNNLNEELFSLKVANVLRNKEDKNIPDSSSLGQKTSDFISTVGLRPNQNFKLKYQHSLDQNLSDTKYQLISTDIIFNNFSTTFEYLNESSDYANDSYLYNKSTYQFSESSQISYETRENKKENITEFYNLIYQYRNDCLIAAIEYNKDYYNFKDLQPEEKLFFKLTIVPFGETSSPNLY
tara:strand:- start:705 stop:3083 length:2379 start_codon:yes stop_codon:yes gene_type:complete